jgi:hypothetical protein
MAKLAFTPKRKLSSKDIVGEDTRLLWKRKVKESAAEGKIFNRIDLYKIGGVVARFDEVPSPYGESCRLIGDFVAINTMSGEVFRSNRAFLPAIMADTLVSAVSQADKGSVVQFGYQVSIIEDVKSATGYVYTFEPLLEANESNQMLKIAEVIGATAERMLPAPEETKGKKK